METIFRTWNLTDADMVRARLEAAGFHPSLLHESTVLPSMTTQESGIQVQVPAKEAEEARAFLAKDPA